MKWFPVVAMPSGEPLLGNQGGPLGRGDVLLYTMLSPENKTELCNESGEALQEPLGRRLCQRQKWPACLEGRVCGRGGQTPGLPGQESQVCSV